MGAGRPDPVRPLPGSPEPLGVVAVEGGLNVAVFSAHAETVDFCVFEPADDREIGRFRLPGRTGDVFHGFIPGLAAGTRYGLRADGPWRPGEGLRFNPAKLLVDPYATAIDRPFQLHPSLFDARRLGAEADAIDSAPHVPRAIVTEPPPRAARLARPVPWSRQVIYELHVRGFTMLHPEIPPEIRGTFAGLAHPAAIAHLRELGVTTVEIMPAAAWLDERHLPPLGLSNYWGYNPVAYCAPDPRLAPGGFAEIRSAVAALHEAGIAVILDVVLNHSAESDHLGPTVSMRGLDNSTYYRLVDSDRSLYANDAGCGNILAAERPAVVRLMMDSLRIWAERTGLDGFRFDLATTLARRPDGFDAAAPFLIAVEQDPLLRELILIAEPWDIGLGGYQVGNFPAAWGEWNDRYRDTARRFFQGEGGMIGQMATGLAGSADIFAARHRPLSRSINFITAHDGFTLADLVAYERKDNIANGEDNRDGTDGNHSWNNGVEGPTDDPLVLARRRHDVRALLAALILSRGTPMLSMGDELGRSQHGNNNAYAQDNAIAWLDWDTADRDLIAFARQAISVRERYPVFHGERPLTGLPEELADEPDVVWLGADGAPLAGDGWADPGRRILVALYAGRMAGGENYRLCLVLKGGAEADGLTLPASRRGRRWRRLIDSSDALPAELEGGATVPLAGRATLLFIDES